MIPKQKAKHTKINYQNKVKVINIEGMNGCDDYPLIYFTKIKERLFLCFESKIILFYLVSIYIFNGVVVQIYCLTVLIRTKTHKKFMCSLIMNIRNKGIKFSLLSDIMK